MQFLTGSIIQNIIKHSSNIQKKHDFRWISPAFAMFSRRFPSRPQLPRLERNGLNGGHGGGGYPFKTMGKP